MIKRKIFRYSINAFAAMIILMTLAAHPSITQQFSATLINHITQILPKEIQTCFNTYQKDVWEGYRIESDIIRSKKELVGFNPIKEVKAKETTIAGWLKNYKEDAKPIDHRLTRTLDRIMQEQGGLIRDIEEFYRYQTPKMDEILERFSDSDIIADYKGFQEEKSVADILAKQLSMLKLKSKISLSDLYESLLTSCSNGIILLHVQAGRKIDLAKLQPAQLKISNAMMMIAPMPVDEPSSGGHSSDGGAEACVMSCAYDMQPCIDDCLSSYDCPESQMKCMLVCQEDGLACVRDRCGIDIY